jgi:hypothetical protein
MKLPNRENASVPASKLTDYLLSETHSVGRSKAKFLRLLGFDESNVQTLEQGLLAIAQTGDVKEVAPSRHGTKYVIEGGLSAPDGRSAQVQTVWIIDAGQDRPRFVTTYPL